MKYNNSKQLNGNVIHTIYLINLFKYTYAINFKIMQFSSKFTIKNMTFIYR